MPSGVRRSDRNAAVTDGPHIFSVFKPMLFFPPRTSTGGAFGGIATDNSVGITTSSDHLETGHLLWEAVDTALSQLSVEYHDSNQPAIGAGLPLLYPPFSSAGALSISLRAPGPAGVPFLPVSQTPPAFPIGSRRGSPRGHSRPADGNKGQPIPILFPLGWSKQGGNALGSSSGRRRNVDSPSHSSSWSSSGGVNHLNLIQIMGRTAHAWQPHLAQDPLCQGRSIVIRPDLKTAEMNSILLTFDAVEPRKTRYRCKTAHYYVLVNLWKRRISLW